MQAKNLEIVSNWEQLVEKARLRKQKLDESYFLHRFLADFRDLTSWINDIKTVISADELAKVRSGDCDGFTGAFRLGILLFSRIRILLCILLG